MHKLVTNFPTFHMHVFVMLTQHGQPNVPFNEVDVGVECYMLTWQT